MQAKQPFWQSKTLEQMNAEEWESLCDRCGQCCLIRLIDDETDELHVTRIACRLFDHETGACMSYANREQLVPYCLHLTPGIVKSLSWMPESCAYRRLSEGRDLPQWHPLVTGQPESVKAAGKSICGRALNEGDIPEEDLQDYIIPQSEMP